MLRALLRGVLACYKPMLKNQRDCSSPVGAPKHCSEKIVTIVTLNCSTCLIVWGLYSVVTIHPTPNSLQMA